MLIGNRFSVSVFFYCSFVAILSPKCMARLGALLKGLQITFYDQSFNLDFYFKLILCFYFQSYRSYIYINFQTYIKIDIEVKVAYYELLDLNDK